MAFGRGNKTEFCGHCRSILYEGEIEILPKTNQCRSNYWAYVTARSR